MTTDELINYLRALPTDEPHVSIPLELIDDIIASLTHDIVILSDSGEELARLDGELAESVWRHSVETYILDALTNSAFTGTLERLRHMAKHGTGRFSQFEALYLFNLIEKPRRSTGTITMGGEEYDIVKRDHSDS